VHLDRATDSSGAKILTEQDTRQPRAHAIVAFATSRSVMVILGTTRAAIAFLLTTLMSFAAPVAAQAPPATASSHQKLTFDGDTALWTVAIKSDKTADFEKIMAKVGEALAKSEDPQRRAQAASWKVMRVEKPLADGTIAYVHIVDPVVKGADYTIMQTLYEAYPEERQALYELYRGAFAQNLSLATGSVAVDLSGAPE